MRQMQRQVPGQDWDLEWLREELGVGRRGGVCRWGRHRAGWGWDDGVRLGKSGDGEGAG